MNRFSYKNEFFKPVLAASFAAHLAVLGGGAVFQGTPRFSVQEAPASMEVQIIPVPEEKEPEPKQAVIAEEAAPEEAPAVEQPPVKPEEPKKAAPQNPRQGAIVEAKPDPGAHVNEPPVYPRTARERGWEGDVLVRVRVSAEGGPVSVELERTSGYGILDEAALRAIRRWRFVPASMGSVRYESTISVPVKFLLTDEE